MIILFLITEIPAAAIFSIHVSTVALRITFFQRHYTVLNKLLIVRNVLIVMTYPLRFAIYCGMSQQFREVVRQMLSHRIVFPWGKRANDWFRQHRQSRSNGCHTEITLAMADRQRKATLSAQTDSPPLLARHDGHGYQNLLIDKYGRKGGAKEPWEQLSSSAENLHRYVEPKGSRGLLDATKRSSSIRQSLCHMGEQARVPALAPSNLPSPNDSMSTMNVEDTDCML